jgi:hypothetical protein
VHEEQRVSRGFRCDTGDIAAKRVTLEILLSAGFVVPSVDVIDHERREPLAFGRVIQPPGSVPKTRRRGLLHDRGGAGGATRTASARRTHSRASINDGRGARRGGDGQHQGADRLKAPQPDAGDSTEEQAGQRTPDAGRDGSAGGCADLTFAIRDHRRRSPPTPVLVYSRPGAPNARTRNRRPPTPAIPSSSRLSSVMLRAFGRTAQTTEPNPLAGRAGQAPFIEILLSTPPSPTIAPLVTAQGWDDTSVTRWTAALSRTSVGSSSMCMAGRE